MSTPGATRWRRTGSLGRALVGAVRDENVSFLAAAVAYYAFVSLLPLLLLALAVGSFVGGAELATAAVGAAGGLLAPAGEDLVRDALVGAEGRGGATVAGIAILLWSGLRLFRGLDAAFSDVYGVDRVESLRDQFRDAGVVLGSVGVAVGAVLVVGGLVPTALPWPAGDAVAALSLPVMLAAAFLPIYYVFPDVALTLREVLPGTVGAAVAWSSLVGAFRLYAANAGQYDLYGVLGGALVLVTWLYVAATVIILGAILNAVLAGRDDDGDDGDATGSATDGGGETTGPAAADADDSGRAAADADGSSGPRVDDGDDPSGSAGSGRGPTDEAPASATDVAALEAEVEELRARLEEKTVDRSDLEADLRRYVRSRLRRGHARGWGPYLVLLYGTGMTLGAFFWLSGGWAILAMLVVWLSTLGLYTLMLVVGAGVKAAGTPFRALDAVRDWRS